MYDDGLFLDVSNATWDVVWYSGSGLCGDVAPPVLRDWFRANCKRSCGICQAECANTLEGDGALDSDARCALLLASHPGACSETVTQSFVGPLSALWVRNKCLKSCLGSDFRGGAPCVGAFLPDLTLCELPFEVGATVYSAPITVATVKPALYSELMVQLGRAENLADLWCPKKGYGVAYDPATSATPIVYNPGPREIPTSMPTASPTASPSPATASPSPAPIGDCENTEVVCFPDEPNPERFADSCVPKRVRARLEWCLDQGVYDCDLADVVPSDGIVWLNHCDQLKEDSEGRHDPPVFPVIKRPLHVFSSAHDASSPLRLQCDRRLYRADGDGYGRLTGVPAILVDGGDLVDGVKLQLSNVSVSDCGGGVAYLGGSNPALTAVNSVFTNCGSFDNRRFGGVVTIGGQSRLLGYDYAPYDARGANLTFTNCTLRGNRARSGGVWRFQTEAYSLEVSDSRVVNNAALLSGGVMSINERFMSINDSERDFVGGRVVIQRSDLSHNMAGLNGGVVVVGPHILLLTGLFERTLLSSNRAERGSGGVLFFAGFELGGRDQAMNGEGVLYYDWPLDWRVSSFFFTDSTMERNRAGADGGALWIEQNGNNQVVVERCIVANNSANSEGGAAFIKGTATRLPQRNSYVGNNGITSAQLFFQATRQLRGLTLRDSSVTDNSALLKDGGAVCAEPFTSLLVENCNVSGNTAQRGGFCSLASTVPERSSELELRGVTMERNSAYVGGALHVGAGAELVAHSCTLRGNVADDMGGAAIVVGLLPGNTGGGTTHTQTMQGPPPDDNTGDFCADGLPCSPGLLCNTKHTCVAAPVAAAARTRLSLGKTLLVDNRAGSCGGAVAVQGDASVVVDAAWLSGNTAAQGGALCARGESNATMKESVLENNAALSRGGAVSLASGARLVLNASLLALNSAGQLGGAIAVEYGSHLAVLNCTARSNKVTLGVGGAVGVVFAAERAPDVSIYRSTLDGNLALFGNDLGVENTSGLSTVEILPSSFRLRFNSSNATISCEECAFAGAAPQLGSAPARLVLHFAGFQGKTCQNLGPVYDGAALEVAAGHDLPLLCAVLYDGLGKLAEVHSEYTLTLDVTSLDFEVRVTAPITITASDRAALERIEVSGSLRNGTVLVAPSALYHASGPYADSARFSQAVQVALVECPGGQVLQQARCVDSAPLAEGGWYLPDPRNTRHVERCRAGTVRPQAASALKCEACPAGSVAVEERTQCNRCEPLVALSWNPSDEACRPCPADAECSGGDRVAPKAGFFHSSMRSYQFHQCLPARACDYDGRRVALERVRNESGLARLIEAAVTLNLQALKAGNETAEAAYAAAQCAPGYAGPLCGSCARGYQRHSGECRPCASATAAALYVSGSTGAVVAFLCYTVYKAFTARRFSSLTIKIVIAFAQQLSLLSTFRIGWPAALAELSNLVGAAMAGDIKTFGCVWSEGDVPGWFVEAVAKIYAVPALLMAAVPLAVAALRSTGLVRYPPLDRKHMVTILIVCYFFTYPAIAVGTAKLFSCVAIDSDKVGPYREFATARAPVMLVDTKYECYSGWHATAIALVAVPALAVLVLALPAALALFLRSNATRFKDTDFERRFGFVYLGLEPRRWWWFFLATARTSVLAVIGLLVRNPGFQNLVAQAWVLAYLAMLAAFRPYALRTLQLMDAVSVICILTLLHIDMWVLIARMFQETAYDTLLAVLTLSAPVITFSLLVALTVKVWVADRTGRRSSTVAAAQVSAEIKRIVTNSKPGAARSTDDTPVSASRQQPPPAPQQQQDQQLEQEHDSEQQQHTRKDRRQSRAASGKVFPELAAAAAETAAAAAATATTT